MRNKLTYILLLSALAINEPLLAIALQSQNALTAFRRYEPFFSTSLRKLQNIDRNQEKDMLSEQSDVLAKAEEIMAKVEDRYIMMEQVYNNALANNPVDQPELLEGFNRVDDVYREVRDYYADTFVNGGKASGDGDTNKSENSSKEVKELSSSDKETSMTVPSDEEVQKVIKWTGSLRFQYRDAEEKHLNANGNKVPNDNTNGRLILTYEVDENRSYTFEEKYLTRERNEKIKENHFTLSYLERNGDNSAVTLRDKLQHVWYPDDVTKNYRINLFEILYAKNWKERERVLNLGVKTKTYPRNSRSDYNQYIVGDQETWYSKNSTIYAEVTGESVKYKNVNNLDYDNLNLYAEMNKTYSGNKAELKISNNYERRIYDVESLVAFRTSYYDDFFQLDYELPVNDRVTYTFNGDYTKRDYKSDEARGYKQVDVFNGFTIKSDNRTTLIGDFRYVYNDENTRDSAHKNNIYHIGWVRNINKDYKIKLDETYHTRNSVQNAVLDFNQNQFTADFSWRIKKDYKLSWITEHCVRRYDNISIDLADYRYIESGFVYSYYKRRNYDWKLSQKWRNMEYRNWAGLPSDWRKHVQPVTEVNYNKWLSEKLKLSLRATFEKTYYSEFNNNSQELEYNFGDLVSNKEIFASLEYIF